MNELAEYIWGYLPIVLIGTILLLFAAGLGWLLVFLIRGYSIDTRRKRWATKLLTALKLNFSTFALRLLALLIIGSLIWAFAGFPDLSLPWKVAANG